MDSGLMQYMTSFTVGDTDQPEICGVIWTPGKDHRGLEVGKGSSINVSITAPPSQPFL